MSRNFTSEQTLIDHLLLDDSAAFEELYQRYWFPLYRYGVIKLGSPEAAKQIVRNLFVELWQNRHGLPADFSASAHLYAEVRKAVIKTLNEKLQDENEAARIGREIIPGFAVMNLKQASRPVRARYPYSQQAAVKRTGRNRDTQWRGIYFPLPRLKRWRHAFQQIMNLW